MLTTLRRHWHDIKEAPPGCRFKMMHEKRRRDRGNASKLQRWLMLPAGIALTLAGIFFLPAPGPGTIVLIIGLAMLASESIKVATLLDWVEVRLRAVARRAKRFWHSINTPMKVAVIGAVLTVALVVTVAAAMWVFG